MLSHDQTCSQYCSKNSIICMKHIWLCRQLSSLSVKSSKPIISPSTSFKPEILRPVKRQRHHSRGHKDKKQTKRSAHRGHQSLAIASNKAREPVNGHFAFIERFVRTYRWSLLRQMEDAVKHNLWLMISHNQPLCALTHTRVQVPLLFDEYDNRASSNGLIFHEPLQS